MFKKSLKDFFKNPIITVPGILFSLLLGTLSYYGVNPDVINKLEQAGESGNISGIGSEAAVLYSTILLIFILSIFLSPLLTSWSYLLTRSVVANDDSGVVKNFKHAFGYYWRMFTTIILKGLIFIVTFVIFAIVVISLGILSSKGSTVNITIMSIISVIFVIGVIFLAVSLLPVEPVLVFDNLSIGKSFSRGFRFGVKKFFPILGAIIPVAAVILIFYIFLNQYTYVYALINAYFGMFITVYIMNLYNEFKAESDVSLNITQELQNEDKKE